MPEYTVQWIANGKTPTGSVSFVQADDYAGAVWEATRLLRAKVKHERGAVNQGLYGTGFRVLRDANWVWGNQDG